MSTIRAAQLDPFALSGAGASLGDTSITLKSFQTIDGVNLAMSDFGSIGFGTLDPGNGALEEQISFTGVVQNASGTATLTGISSVTFLNPYTATSGLAKTHAGSTAFVISNTSGFYNNIPFKQNDETIDGQWTFTNTPIVPGTVSDASTTVKGVSKLSVAALLSTNPIVVGDNDTRVPQNAYATDSGTANTYAITLTPAPAAYASGQIFAFKAAHASTAASTLNVNSLGAKTIKLPTGADVGANVIITGQIVEVQYDGTNFQMVSPIGYTTNYQAFTASGTWTKPINCTGNEIVIVQAWGAGGAGGDAASSIGGGGGGGGGFVENKFLASALTSTVTVTIGAGATGSAGGNTTFGAFVTAYGGGKGNAGTASGAGGGGGGGQTSAGSNASTVTGGAGGGPAGSAANGNGSFGGGGGGTVLNAGGGSGIGGGGGGASSSNGTQAGAAGGASLYGGGGGGGGSNSGGSIAGGTSVYAGAGGTGGTTPAAGTAPGGGGGGGGTGAAGARGEVRVWTISS